MSADEGYRRPTTVPEMQERMQHFVTPEGLERALAYQAEPSDVFVVTPPKCGTTWMQQIVHGLRTGGSLDFDNINDVVPWLQMAHDVGRELDAPQVARPHAFKTHSPLDEVPQGGRYIVVVRDPKDALLSHFRFFEGAFFEPGSIDLETFSRDFAESGSAVHRHVLAAWSRRHDADVLLLAFENMKADLSGTVERVARFIGVDVDDEVLEVVVSQSSFEHMVQHADKYDDAAYFDLIRHRLELPPVAALSKVAEGKVGTAASAMPVSVRQGLAAAWTAEVTPHTGLESYDDLREQLVYLSRPI